MTVLRSLLQTLRTSMRTRAALQLEILAMRHQLQVLERSRPRRLRLTGFDRLLWVWLSRVWQGWRAAVVIVTGTALQTSPREAGRHLAWASCRETPSRSG